MKIRVRKGECAAVAAAALVCVSSLAGAGWAIPVVVDYTYDTAGRLTSATYDGNWTIIYGYDLNGNMVSVVSGPGATPVGNAAAFPDRYALGITIPNPFSRRTTIGYQVPKRSPVRLEIFDVTGRRVRALVDASRPAGQHTQGWDGNDDGGRPVASGTYFYRMQAGGFVDTKKLVLIR